VELESGLLPAPAGSATLSVSWRARSRQIRDHHRAQRRGSSRRYKRRLTLLQEGVSWFHSLLCSAPLRALNVVTRQGPGLSEIAFINALLRQFMARSARRYHGPYSWSPNCMSRRSLALPRYTTAMRKLLQRMGIGLSICRSIIEAHEGPIGPARMYLAPPRFMFGIKRDLPCSRIRGSQNCPRIRQAGASRTACGTNRRPIATMQRHVLIRR
jgi:hypothetical protein